MASEKIDDDITIYHRIGYNQSEIVNSLLVNHYKVISERHLRRHAKFCRNRLNHGRDMLIFRFFCSTDILSLHLVVGRVIAVKS